MASTRMKDLLPGVLLSGALLGCIWAGWKVIAGFRASMLKLDKELQRTHKLVRYHEQLLRDQEAATLSVLNIQWSEIQIERENMWTNGATASVHVGHWRGMKVAVKSFGDDAQRLSQMNDSFHLNFKREVHTLFTVRHENVVTLLAAGNDPVRGPFIVMELMDFSLQEFLKDSKVTISSFDATDIALQIALGMSTMHNLRCIHRDLKSSNILGRRVMSASRYDSLTLLADHYQFKVADVGFAAFFKQPSLAAEGSISESGEQSVAYTVDVGTPLWMAPEVLQRRTDYTQLADVYSFGIIMWEIASRSTPWPDIDPPNLAMKVLQRLEQGERPPIDPSWSPELVSLMKQCWSFDAAQRPTFAQICSALRAMNPLDHINFN
eukprot:m.241988 g.241988  ORF g.241988 m.241988 type:complete len:379 (-) comp13946_c0_seq1:269-1405(-)